MIDIGPYSTAAGAMTPIPINLGVFLAVPISTKGGQQMPQRT